MLAGSPGFVGRQTPIDDGLDCTDGFQIPPADVTSVARGKPKGARRRQMSTGSSSSMSDFDDDVTSSKGRPDSAGVKSKQYVLIKKFGQQKPADFQQKMKQMNFLQRRGFTSDQIRKYYDERD